MVGLLAMGSLLAALIAFFYSVHTLRLRPPQPVEPLPPPTFEFVVFEPAVIGPVRRPVPGNRPSDGSWRNPNWVPVSCLAVIQGATLRAVWTRKLHRILGTAVGLGLALVILTLPLDKWSIAAIMTVLAFIIETAVVRHYGFAVIFITPLTILLADAAALGAVDPVELLRARFLDTCLGCLIGLAGGLCLHTPRFRTAAEGALRTLIPRRFR